MSRLVAHATLITEKLLLPKKTVNKLLGLMGELKERNILEYGCNVGTLTLELARKTGPKGHVYATELFEADIKLLKKRLKKHNLDNVTIIQDENHRHQVSPKVPKVDIVVSAGMLSYTHNIKKVLKELNDRLIIGGKIVALEYDNFYGFVDNEYWLKYNTTIEQTFYKAGFDVSVERSHGPLWQYIFIYGKKVRNV
ncbi:class I SAM-dependent methyltransferase [Candidatus Woesearchaeota archaeon]|nr:class I SAM-dependent methyltransferase [Candidatus Woesearchaeota archaeon]